MLIACSDRETGISIVDTGSGSVLAVFSRGPNSKVSKMAWSPLGSYLVAWERWAPGLENLAVWSVGAPEAPVATFSQKNPPTPETWPTVQWTADEAVAAHVVTNEVHFYAGSDVGGQRITKLRVEGLRGFSLSPGTPQYRVSIYKPEHKGSPAQVRLYQYPNFDEGQQIATKSFFNAESVTFIWEAQGRAVLVRSSTAVDKSSKQKFGGSDYYYGSSSLYYMSSDGSMDSAVALDKEGPVQDVAWVPGNMQFVVVYGYMPASAVLFDHKCNPVLSYGVGYVNTIKWSPSGRFVALCGFGNLPGDIHFWDKKKGADGRMGITKNEAAVSAEFSPCSRYFLCGTLFPRLRVDNGFNIWRVCDGTLLHHEAAYEDSELYQVAFRPALPGVYPPPPDPDRYLPKDATLHSASGGASGGDAAKVGAYVPGKGLSAAGAGSDGGGGGAYRPPGQRGGGGGGGRSLAELAGETGSSAGRVTSMRKGGPIGGFVEEKMSASQKKNAKKKAAAKRQAEEAAAAAVAGGNGGGGGDGGEAPAAATAGAGTAGGAVDPAKEAKKIQKKLRQIDDLKKKQADGATLEPNQMAKLATEDELRSSLAQLAL